MSEPIWCTVKIKLPTSWNGPDEKAPFGDSLVPGAPAIVELLSEALINGTDPDAEVVDDATIWTVSGEGNYGLADDDVVEALSWLREYGVPHWAQDDPKYEMVGSVTLFDGETSFDREGGESGVVVLSEPSFAAMAAQLDDAGLLAAIRAVFTLPELSTCSIAHLPAEYPADEPERGDAAG